MKSEFEVRTVSMDLRHQETLMQMADILDHLGHVTDTVFNRVSDRLVETQNTLKNLHSRAENVQKRVDILVGSKSATTVCSSSKFPGPKELEPVRCMFGNNSPEEMKRSNLVIKEQFTTTRTKDLKEKLQFLHVKPVKDSLKGTRARPIKSVSSLLLFNENDNSQAIVIDETDHTETDNIAEAPFSLSHSQLECRDSDDFVYAPSVENVPVFDAPLTLPDLPGVADNLSFSTDIGSNILLPQSVFQPQLISQSSDSPANVKTNSNESIAHVQKTESLKDPLLPKVGEIVSDHSSKSSDTKSADLASTSSIPPPPPPPPAPLSEIKQAASEPFAASAATLDIRSSLMDAIRKAGGSENARLRPTSQQKVAKQKKSDETMTPPSGDLMADLAAKLTMRRKGISGVVQGQDQIAPPTDASNSALSRISAKIPAPPINRYPSESPDEEWD